MTSFVHQCLFWFGYQLFKVTKRTFDYPYFSFRRLFVLTKGKVNDDLSVAISRSTGKYKLNSTTGVLGNLNPTNIQDIVAAIDRDGFYVFPNKLEDELVAELKAFSLTLEAEMIPPAPDGTKRSNYDSEHPLSPRYQFSEKSLAENHLIQRLSADESLIAVAQEYLGAKPIQDLTAMWWSTAFSKKASSAAAQQYHFDMDRIKFIKFFFYLTDVDTNTGPHCYIRGTHRHMPSQLWKDGRIMDEEIEQVFDKNDCVEIVGTKGSIIAVDTRGLHKGKPLQHGQRLILQFEFTNSLFGAKYEEVTLQKQQASKDFLEKLKAYPYIFQRFFVTSST